VAAAAIGQEHTGSYFRHWTTFGPVTVAMKNVESAMVVGDSRTVVRLSADDSISPKAWKSLGRPSDNDVNRHRLDVARAHARTRDLTAAMDDLNAVRRDFPEWIKHQAMAAETMREILKRRKRTLPSDMREMATYLGVVG
jgi:alkylhydroperoxidase/carboxymuconolactone decarboxylase family protein YurZ